MSIIKKKRESLEQFIKEQTLGPGINGFRYVDIENKRILESDIKSLKPGDYFDEIIDIVPAAVYSTGILFPQDDSETCVDGIVLDNNENIENEDGSEEIDSQNW